MTTPTLRPLDAEATVKTLNQEAARFQALAGAQAALAATAQQHKLGDVAATALTLKRVYEEAAERLYSIVDAVVSARPGQAGQAGQAGQGQVGQAQLTPQPAQPASTAYFKQVSPSTYRLAQRVLSSQLKPAQRYVALAQLLDSDDVSAQLPQPILAELRTAYVLICKDLPQLDAVQDSLIELQRRWIAQSSEANVGFVAKALGFVSSVMGLIETSNRIDVATYRTGIDHAVANLQAGLWPGGEIQATGQAIIIELQRLRHDAAIRKRLDAT